MNRLVVLLSSLCLFFGVAGAQTILNCAAVSVPPIVPGEGIAERTGDITINCSGGSPGARITGNLSFFLSVNITNHLSANNVADVVLTVDNGSGPQPANVPAVLTGPAGIVFNGLSFTLSPTGTAVLRLANLRAAAIQVGLIPNIPITAFPALNAGSLVSLTTTQLPVATILRGLYAGTSSRIVCAPSGSPLPDDTTSFAAFLNSRAVFNTTRLTEGFADAFNPRTAWQGLNADTGARFLIRYNGFPPNARLFVPDVVAGSDALKPTAAGDFGGAPSGGAYAPTANGSLLLARVRGADASGAGGVAVYQPGAPGSGTVQFDSMSEVALTNGTATVVYEVVDANPSIQESAQFPTFLGLPPSGNSATDTFESISFAPVSTVLTATAKDPVPRYQFVTPPPDCTIVGDCGANYFPHLVTYNVAPLSFTAQAGSAYQVAYVQIQNQGGGLMRWNASIAYTNGSDWLRLFPTSGINNSTLRIDALPGNLVPGTYKATLTIDAGPLAGAAIFPVTLTITAGPPPVVQPTTVLTVVNSATFQPSPLAPGSIASLLGTKLSGKSVSVTFDGIAGQVLYSSDSQINVVVPADLGTKTSAQVIVTADGNASTPQPISLAPFGPGIFKGGILNQDNTVNAAAQPAAPGSIIQIFATGLSGSGVISARIGDRVLDQPYYAGPAPGLMGVQQVDLMLPADLTGPTADVSVCGAATPDKVVCSPPLQIAIAN